MRRVAAGHPATAEAGAEILADGGSAADAAVAACLASCVAETVMTGLLGGGHAIYFDAATGRAGTSTASSRSPGSGASARDRALLELEVPFGAELVHYAVGPASCGVPVCLRGSTRSGALTGGCPGRVCRAGARLARDGVRCLPAHAACLGCSRR